MKPISHANNVLPGRLPRRGFFGSFRARLILYFCLIFVVVLVAVESISIVGLPFTSFEGRLGQQQREAFKNLDLIADLKKELLLQWMEERRDDTHVISNNDMIAAEVARIRAVIREFTAAGKGNDDLRTLVRKATSYKMVMDYLNSVRISYGVYEKIQIADASTGKIFVSTDETDLGKDVYQQHQLINALKTQDEFIGDIKFDRRSLRPVFHMNHVIKSKKGERAAVLIMVLNLDDIIKPILHTGAGLGAQGEALLLNQDLQVLTSLKHPPA